VLQSAGQDGYFLGNKDKARKQFLGNALDYQINFVNTVGGTAYTDKDGNRTNTDVISAFDDLTASAGN
jgi:hypothetical protein